MSPPTYQSIEQMCDEHADFYGRLPYVPTPRSFEWMMNEIYLIAKAKCQEQSLSPQAIQDSAKAQILPLIFDPTVAGTHGISFNRLQEITAELEEAERQIAEDNELLERVKRGQATEDEWPITDWETLPVDSPRKRKILLLRDRRRMLTPPRTRSEHATGIMSRDIYSPQAPKPGKRQPRFRDFEGLDSPFQPNDPIQSPTKNV
ncbi:hypothetical protein BCR34DRAFT_73800 [Clohesyomyces aquaticus]|uniref:Uncharacterized protein n=1 Tax=Clohesyomyces aquaticus TaxID=1231657 RepID=A0A1Y2A357_9PLEO|nr:hypothetical protein BCR34DRAFT_73800 [Clohesyomyces aquaticus]